MKTFLFAALIAISSACGPSSAEIKAAQTARYNAPTRTLYDIAKQTASDDYKIGEENSVQGAFATVPQWYSPEGGRQSNGAGDFVQLDDKSVELQLIVEVVPLDEGGQMVNVRPKVFQHLSGSPQPRELKPDDPNMPGWVGGRVEALQAAIYKNAKQYEMHP